MTNQDNITHLYNSLTIGGLKQKVTMAIADVCGITYNSVKTNRLGKGKTTPDKDIDRTISVLHNAVKFQNEYINNINVNL
jgi:hypothetical protein